MQVMWHWESDSIADKMKIIGISDGCIDYTIEEAPIVPANGSATPWSEGSEYSKWLWRKIIFPNDLIFLSQQVQALL